jgi:hypothetical protein
MKQITIILNEDGRFLVNWGKDTTTVCRSEKEAIIWIKEQLGKLKYFPVGNGIINRRLLTCHIRNYNFK